jgi:hypothetical protein
MTHGKFKHFLWGATLVTVGVIVCMTGRIEGGYSKGIYKFPIEGPSAVIIGACMIAMGMWAFYPLVKGAIEETSEPKDARERKREKTTCESQDPAPPRSG